MRTVKPTVCRYCGEADITKLVRNRKYSSGFERCCKKCHQANADKYWESKCDSITPEEQELVREVLLKVAAANAPTRGRINSNQPFRTGSISDNSLSKWRAACKA